MKTLLNKRLIIFLSMLCAITNITYAQNTFPSTGAAGIGTTTPNASSLLEIKSTTKGLLIPRMTQAQRNAITSPATGLMIYQTNATPGFYYYGGGGWKSVAAKAWGLTGNAGTDSSINFIGTTDAHPLVFRVKNVKSGIIDSTYANTSLGYASLFSNSTGNSNTAEGYHTLFANTMGHDNTATGGSVLFKNTTGSNNTADGAGALYNNLTGSGNVALGKFALYSNTNANSLVAIGDSALYNNGIGAFFAGDASANIAIGVKALYSNGPGSYNTATGYAALYSNYGGEDNSAYGINALYSNTGGSFNTANGANAMYSNTYSSYNTATGYDALYSNQIGEENTAIGFHSLYYNTASDNTAVGAYSLIDNSTGNSNTATGSFALGGNSTGSGNTADGYNSLSANTYGSNLVAIGFNALSNNGTGAVQSYDGVSNTAIGSSSLNANHIGYNNTASGYESLLNNTTGYNNSAYGVQALQSNVNGLGNTAIGVAADVNAGGLQNATAIGYYAKATASNQIMLGSLAVTSVEAAGSYVVYSDGRFKKNINDNTHGLDFINLLKPVTYNYDIHKLNAYITPQTNKNDTINAKEKNDIEQGIKNKESILYSGFIAQDVEAVANKIGYDFSGIHKPQNDKDPYGLSYSDFVVPLVKAVQELSALNDDKDAKIDTLQKQNETLQKEFEDLRTLVLSIQQQQQSCSPCSATINQSSNQSAVVLTNVNVLAQNIPNPFSHTTSIGYSLNQKFSSAQIVITDKSGRTIKAINVASNKGNVAVDASTLASGAYQYSLIVDGRLIDTKQMVLAK